MRARTAYLLVGGAVVGTALVAVVRAGKRADERVSGLPSTPGLVWNVNRSTAYVAGAAWLGKPLAQWVAEIRAAHKTEPMNVQEQAVTAFVKPISNRIQLEFSKRRRSLPKDASPNRADGYSKEEWIVPGWIFTGNWDSAGGPIDEFGRMVGGANIVWGSGDTNPFGVLAHSVDTILSNPIVQAGLVVSGPQGAAIVAGYRLWKTRGELTSPKSAAINAGRIAVGTQCGAGCQIAYDMGVGVSMGNSKPTAAKNALRAQLSPEQRNAFDAGERATERRQ